ncbi:MULTISPECIES: 2-oxoglutarate dehydrogenase complex dihydrolipoyllysine-residue succinyltransferase [Stappiaceae]|jgi:2-oxoglutarate dehydrogenase E2 component (dihydrolipoamide succinyltransferase)|uniref:Dihydrolipoyllysine-residue succinyltransferase component of 2-oxoglutarate dehydrogenase complex n=1 Tax=Roseibium aggregatum TaxID=187304 RepID=A0A0M6Y5W9_9HYPH|nr:MULTISPECIES: 2-oxoglutarate dehydrogenase complex dihydrolipoyllysine-residue succinyltransferase [Stappiaceae]MCR9285735.1 2-oxoglutarate dehydrogenase complex dihydrolipoyllysine-residue succinyltransferase [Paracoccaceae bacterium]MBO6860280.1 2-oxoglutarate dehydrogenase complex dihydrolipoyllysine-residue succinyltransferase [Roseibium sp.]QFS96491.1 Dihydrolipoyllysine-residue succinyltransferase component of 2-oxoglutarate dehydrogenase complex [Labrenzia sp. THAF191b]QFT02806.1 Dihy
MATEIRVPTLGESVSEATIAQWFKKPGDAVSQDEPLVELETDKVTVEVPAPAAGTLESIVVKEGDTVEVGALLGQIAEGAGAPAAKAEAAPAKADAKAETKSEKAQLVDVVTPSAGESVTEAEVGEWSVKVGDVVKADDTLVELETDKAAQEVPAPVAGTIVKIAVETGTTVEPGVLLCQIDPSGEGAAAAPAAAAPAPAASAPAASGGSSMPPAPSAQKMMAENNLSADQVAGSGKRGQVLKEDVINAIASGATSSSSAPSAAPVARGPVAAQDEIREERVRMTKLRQTIARRLKDAQNSAAMLTTYNEVDMGPVMELRKQYKDLFEKKHGVKLGFMGFFTKAVTHALKEIPAVNAEIDGTDIIYKNFCHIGVAVGTDKGLVVPVVRDADQMSIAEIEQEIGNLGRKARDGKLGMADMSGGTFTISNGGVYGSLMSSPILNAPQSGILGMHKIQERPMAVNGQVVIRPMMYLALSYDHRIVDGKEAVTFLVRVKESLEDPQRLVLDL